METIQGKAKASSNLSFPRKPSWTAQVRWGQPASAPWASLFPHGAGSDCQPITELHYSRDHTVLAFVPVG